MKHTRGQLITPATLKIAHIGRKTKHKEKSAHLKKRLISQEAINIAKALVTWAYGSIHQYQEHKWIEKFNSTKV